MSLVLRPYQVAACDAVDRELARVQNALVVLPTGGGKTVIFGESIRRGVARGWRVLVLAHRAELIEQAAARVPVDGVEIEMSDLRASMIAPVVVASVQSLHRDRLARWPRGHFDLIVCDEAHRSVAASYEAIREHFDRAKWIGVTATPDRFDRADLSEVYGAPCFELTIQDGVRDGWLVPTELSHVVAKGLRLREIRKNMEGDYAEGALGSAYVECGAPVTIAHTVRDTPHNRAIVFVPSVPAVSATVDACKAIGIDAAGVVGETPWHERTEIIARYRRGEIDTLVNCMVLTEGFDAPETDLVVMARPTKVRSLFLQAIGRGMRPAPGKTKLVAKWLAGEDQVIPSPLGLPSHKRDRRGEWSPVDMSDDGIDVALSPEPDPPLARDAQNYRVTSQSWRVSLDGGRDYSAEVPRLVPLTAYRSKLPDQLTAKYDRTGAAFLALVGIRVSRDGEQPTQRQLDAVTKMCGALKTAGHIDRGTVQRIFAAAQARRDSGMCSLGHAWLLWRYRLPPNADHRVALTVIEQIKKQNWRVNELERAEMWRRLAA